MGSILLLKDLIISVFTCPKNGVVATFFFNVTKLNKLEISMNSPSGPSGHDFLVNVDFQGNNDKVIDQTV